ncbi:MAG: hypothetical protein U5N56_01910 [Candidatus Marinimicrobia bacterium]|nr:hypothetical protein [Candidatus Neomarinimicrobiota bacterium]
MNLNWNATGDSTVASTTIYVRLKSGLSEGSYNGEEISISSTGKATQTVTCSGDVQYSMIVNPTSLTGFTAEPDAPSLEQSFTVSGEQLTDDITLTPPTNYEISTGSGVGFSPTDPITLTQSSGSVASTADLCPVEIRLVRGKL